LREDQHFYTGFVGKDEATTFPQPVTRELIERGHERYDIYCSVCHGLTGDGLGMIVRRGFPPPPSFHQDRLRQAPPGHFYQVITNGFGVMYPYAARVEPADRWAIAAYIRALQLSQNATLADADPAGRQQLEEAAR
jgi:mono/diheme cytochrome c family protein